MKAVAVEAHRSIYAVPISFRKGERLLTGRRDDEYGGWIWVTDAGGGGGWAPEQFLEIDEEGGRALADYCSRELDTEPGEVLVIHRELNGWAWAENERGASGWVPVKTLESCGGLWPGSVRDGVEG